MRSNQTTRMKKTVKTTLITTMLTLTKVRMNTRSTTSLIINKLMMKTHHTTPTIRIKMTLTDWGNGQRI